MKRIVPFSLLLILSLTIFAAFRGNPDDRTIAFDEYLEQLGYEIPAQGSHKFLILTEDGCRGCSREIRDEWHNIAHDSLNVTTILVYYNVARPDKFSQLQNSKDHRVIVDEYNLLTKYATLGVITDGLVEVDDGSVTFSETIDKKNIESIFTRLGITATI
ncbi:MAG: hypothetical protein AAGN35_02390 [Bacteroidota bacterium]